MTRKSKKVAWFKGNFYYKFLLRLYFREKGAAIAIGNGNAGGRNFMLSSNGLPLGQPGSAPNLILYRKSSKGKMASRDFFFKGLKMVIKALFPVFFR